MVSYGEVWAEQLVPGPKLSPLSGSITSLSPPNAGMTHSPHFTPKETEAGRH